jgi:hypothetical protein
MGPSRCSQTPANDADDVIFEALAHGGVGRIDPEDLPEAVPYEIEMHRLGDDAEGQEQRLAGTTLPSA